MSDLADAGKFRRVYGRGFFDGVASVARNEVKMNADRIRIAESSLNGVGRKVYDVVPIEAKWTVAQIVGELKRCGSNMDYAVVQGALNRLETSGLVKSAGDQWWRVKAKARDAAEEAPTPKEAEVVQMVPPTKKDTLTALAGIGRELRLTAERIIALSKEIDECALAAEQKLSEVNKDSEKLRQLQALLKGLA